MRLLVEKKADFEKLREKMHEKALEQAWSFYKKKHHKTLKH